MHSFQILNRRDFLDRSLKLGLGVAVATLVDIPLVIKRALAEGQIGTNGKKLLFIFLRGANDAINSVIPIQDSAYNTDINPITGTVIRPNLALQKDAMDYSALGPCDYPTLSDPGAPTYEYTSAIRLGNGFAALHPSLKFLAEVYNAGDLALLHRVGYPKQSRSHFDSQNYWENGSPNNNLIKDGIFYRAMIESGLTSTQPLTGVSIQSALPLLLRGSAAAMTNLTDPTRYNLLGIPNTAAGNLKADHALLEAGNFPAAPKLNRELLDLQYGNLMETLAVFADINFSESGNTFVDDAATDGDAPYYLFPTQKQKNGGAYLNGRTDLTSKYVVDSSAYSFFTNLKAAALVLNKTDAIVAGTEFTGFDTHQTQGGATGKHANLLRRIGWAIYALRKYFLNYPDKCTWNDLVVVTLSEFGRTTKQNTSAGTDHAEAGVMFVAGGAVKGRNKGNASGVFNCGPNDPIPWVTGLSGSMFSISNNYLRRTTDYRSVLGRILRQHLGATQTQLDRIIPGYANPDEMLLNGGVTPVTKVTDGTRITGELDFI